MTVTDQTPPDENEHGIIWADGGNKVTFSNLGSLNLKSTGDATECLDGMNIWSGASVNITDVDTVNIGTEETPFQTDYFAIQTIGGNVSMDVGSVNIVTTSVGISAQHGSDSGKPSVAITASGDVNIHTKSTAVRAMSLNNGANAGVSITADGKVTLKSDGNSAVQSYDKADKWSGDGKTDITISGKKGVDIVSPDTAAAIYMTRENRNSSSLAITSDEGDVNITGGNGFNLKGAAADEMTASVTGRNVHIASTAGAGIALDNSALDLNVNQEGGAITVDTPNGDGMAVKVSGSKGSLTFGDGQTNTDVYVNGYMTVTDGATATFADKTTTHVDGKYLANTEKSFITATNDSSVSFKDGSKFVIDHAQTGELNFSTNDSINQAFGSMISNNRVSTDNLLQDVTFKGNTMTVTAVSKDEAAKRLGGSALTNVALAATEKNMDSVTALITNNASDTDAVKAALNSAAGFSGLANVAHGTYTMNGLFSDAVSGHLMNRQDQDVWAYGFHSKENVNGLSFGGDYDAQYNGVTAGVDLYKNGGTTAGVALTYGDSNVSGSNGFATTKSDSDYYGASIYGRFDRGSYALLGDISYMKGDHDVTQVNSGETITASPDSDAVSVGVKAVKDFAAGENGTLTPYVGVRYLRLSTDGFTASNGLHYEGDDQDLVLIPVGVNYSAAITGGSWTFRPYAGVGYIWNAGDKSADQTVTLGTAADSFSYDTVDSGSFLTRVGFTADHGDMSYGVGYSYQKGDSVSNNAWTLSASFRF